MEQIVFGKIRVQLLSDDIVRIEYRIGNGRNLFIKRKTAPRK